MSKEEQEERDPDPDVLSAYRRVKPFTDESPELALLRNKLKYLTHGPGGLRSELWEAFLGLVLNLTLFGGLACLLGSLFGTVYGRVIPELHATCSDGEASCAPVQLNQTSLPWWILLISLVGLSLAVGFVSVIGRLPRNSENKLRVFSQCFLALAALYGLVVLVLPQLLAWIHRTTLERPTSDSEKVIGTGPRGVVPLAGLVGLLIAGAAAVRPIWRFFRPIVEAPAVDSKLRNFGRAAWRPTLGLITALAAPALFGGLFVFFLWESAAYDAASWHDFGWWQVFGVLIPALWLPLINWVGDINNWSLHSLYRERLAEGFGLRRYCWNTSEVEGETAIDGTNDLQSKPTGKDPHPSWREWEVPVTARTVRAGLDREIIIAAAPRDLPVPLCDLQVDQFPELVVCATANVPAYGWAPTGFRGTPFLFSPNEIGTPDGRLFGKQPSRLYIDRAFGGKSTISVMDAVSISGAAVSPMMGRRTRAPLRVLMALANLRLGVWIRQPWVVENRAYTQRPTLLYLLYEALGSAPPPKETAPPKEEQSEGGSSAPVRAQRPTRRRQQLARLRPRGKFVYVTDGGHYDNLGLVELLRRRSNWIWCIDASGDDAGSFTRLGQALAIAKAEFGIDVKIKPESDMGAVRLNGKDSNYVHAPFSRGTISYPRRNGKPSFEGTLIVVKAGVPKSAPFSVRAYEKAQPPFPRHPTTDQLYDADRFDAYLALGESSMDQAFAAHGADYRDQCEHGRRSQTQSGRASADEASVGGRQPGI